MDEDEELYREMNEDDPFYMGDRDDDDENEKNDDDSQKKENNNDGCLSVIAVFVLISAGIWWFM